MPDAPGLEVGRLAKATFKDGNCETNAEDLLCAASIASAFIVARDFAIENGLLDDRMSLICGDTYGALIKTLQRFFPLKVFPSGINPTILDERSDSRDVAVYFLHRHVLGSFESAGELTSAMCTVKGGDPQIADRIMALLGSGLNQMGVRSLDRFNPKTFRVDFFCFPFHHPKTHEGFVRLNKIIKRFIREHTLSLN